MTCMDDTPRLFVVVGIRHQGQKARTLDRGVELTLKVCLGTGKTSGDDLAIFLDKITQGVEILVVDLLDACRRETTKFATLEKWVLLSVTTTVSASSVCHDLPFQCAEPCPDDSIQ